jgi:integrase
MWTPHSTALTPGVHPKIVQERLGHADISMMLNRYSHVTPDMQRQAADTLDAVFTKVS